jgi:pyridinium-3,5-bisthiocarboxylic acid mononucleotide nickel chelatase
VIGWLDLSAGASGDMLLGALVDAGVPIDVPAAAVAALPVERIRLETEGTTRHGLGATRVHVHAPPSSQHRTWADVRSLLLDAALPTPVREGALAVFERLAVAEGRVHRMPPEDVHFHEVGALDALADVVGVVAGFEHLGLAVLTASPVALGSGSARSAHGVVPIPAPAVLELLAGVPVVAGPVPAEMCTPTGAALVAELVSEWTPLPAMRVTRVGTGAGGRDPAELPNVVRLVLGEPAAGSGGGPVVLESNIDDLDPRLWPGVLDALFAAGASDAWLTPILMKKGRPAHTVSVLCSAQARDGLRGRLFRHTTTFGVREHAVARSALHRDWFPVRVGGGQVRVKVSLAADGTVVHATPEFDDADAVAEAAGRPVREVLDEAVAASFEAGVVVGTPLPPRPADPE